MAVIKKLKIRRPTQRDVSSPAQKPNTFIVGIEVTELFGYYTYRLGVTTGIPSTPSPLLLLYGDNGSGKTTIAQIVFHLLSQECQSGHRTFLAQTKFRKFSIYFSNATVLTAQRKSSKALTGPYEISLKVKGRIEKPVPVSTSEGGAVKEDDVDDLKLDKIYRNLASPPLAAHFLSDNRILQSDVLETDSTEEHILTSRGLIRSNFSTEFVSRSNTRNLTVTPSVKRAETWLRKQAINASNAGAATTSSIYTDIIKRISKAPSKTNPKISYEPQRFIDTIEELSTRAKKFVALGLSPPVPLSELRKIINDATTDRHELLASVLEPYVDSIKSRLDAYQDLEEKLSVFLNILNSFYNQKSVKVTVSNGIIVLDKFSNPLELELLSSGEKQLLLLLCNTIVSTSYPSIFIIDEPELSLNIKWQRKLIDSLLTLAKGGSVQFIMATHSIELLTRHKESVLSLEDISDNS